MERVGGKVAFITGAARGQGRSHAVHLAKHGADIIAVDAPTQIEGAPYDTATADDLAQTVKEVEALGRRILAKQVDVRDLAGMTSFVQESVGSLGRLDIVLANAGIVVAGPWRSQTPEILQTTLDINLTGVYNTILASVDELIKNRGGSIIVTSSICGVRAGANNLSYNASKYGVIGVAKSFARDLAKDNIRVNVITPSSVDTGMLHNDHLYSLFRPDLQEVTREDFATAAVAAHELPVPWLETIDVSNAVLFLASDEARYITGITLPVDAGCLLK